VRFDTRNPYVFGITVATVCCLFAAVGWVITRDPFFDLGQFSLSGFFLGATYSYLRHQWPWRSGGAPPPDKV
jgi:hypothetical protein